MGASSKTCSAINTGSVSDLHWADILTVVIYFIVVILVGVWSSVRSSRGNPRGVFLAGRSMSWLPIGASIFASNIGAPLFMGLAGTAAASGIGGLIFEWHAIPFVLALGWIFIPVFLSSGVYTMPEYLGKRFGGQRLRLYLAVLSLVVYVVTRVSVEMYSGAVFVQLLFGINIYISSIIIVVISAVFAMTGGLTAVLFTDTLQTCVLSLGALILMITSVQSVGGYNALLTKYMHAVPNNTMNSTCGTPRPDSLSLLRHPWTSDYPWVGTLIINCASDIWFWCTDQIMVQRSLSAKSLSHAKGGSLLAGYLKILPFFFFVIPGMAARVLYPDEVACVDPDECMCICQNPTGCSNFAYPLLVLRKLHPGLRGLMLAAIFAACMSTLTSVFNSASTIFTMDIWPRIRKQAGEFELVVVGRFAVAALVGLAIMWIPIMQASKGAELWQYWQSLMSAVGPPWGITFIWGFFWKRTTEKGAFFGMLSGHAVGITRVILVVLYPAPPCTEPDLRPEFMKIHFLYVAGIEIVVTSLIIVVVSLATKPRTNEQLLNVTFWTRKYSVEVQGTMSGENSEIASASIELQEMGDNSDRGVTLLTRDDANETDVKQPSTIRSLIMRCCGVKTVSARKLEDTDMMDKMARMASLREKTNVKTFLDVNAIILLVITAFIIGYFH